jgi:choline kinase
MHPLGEALGINFFKTKDLGVLCQMLELCQENDYFEKGIELAIQQGLDVLCCLVDSSYCTEIDFPEDLTRANQLLQNW